MKAILLVLLFCAGCASGTYTVVTGPKRTYFIQDVHERRYENLYEFFLHEHIPGTQVTNGVIVEMNELMISGQTNTTDLKDIPMSRVLKIKAYTDLTVIWLKPLR